MAALATYTIPFIGVAFASGKSMAAIINPAASGKIVKVWRVWILNNQTTSVTGVLTWLELRRSTAQSSGSAVTAIKHDTNSAALAATVATGATVSDAANGLLRQIFWSNDEPSVSGASMDEWQMVVPLNQVWDAGYGESASVQPLTLREGEGFHVKHGGSSAVGIVDVYFEVTEE